MQRGVDLRSGLAEGTDDRSFQPLWWRRMEIEGRDGSVFGGEGHDACGGKEEVW